MQTVAGKWEELVPQTGKYGLVKSRIRESWKHCLW